MKLLQELVQLNEARNSYGETEFTSYDSWKRACRKVTAAVWFDGDRDISNAMVGPKPYVRGKTLAIGDWDGEKGVINHGAGDKVEKAVAAADAATAAEKAAIKGEKGVKVAPAAKKVPKEEAPKVKVKK